ncbi:hypothetical protein FQA39_LY10576 [Lamprigera yunnana]|nr:hypothetical protein FQA39_LY10576 [Lamprigera yunnana]
MPFSTFTSKIFQIQAIMVLNVLLSNATYRVGVGISDVTGPIVEVSFIGYGNPFQTGEGLHLRQYARAFIIAKEDERIAFVSVDTTMVPYELRKQILLNLYQKYGTLYNDQNFILSATHTHATPGGQMTNLLYEIPSLGFVRQTFDALHSGTVKAVVDAHNSLQSAKIFINSETVLNVNINRSPLAYLLNPKTERDEYSYDVDKELIQLKFIATVSDKLLGVLHWYPVHPTSMNNTNRLVSSDNLGYASVLMEKYLNPSSFIGQGPIVAAFAASNLGDVSPNIKGPRCITTGMACDDVTSTCDGRSQQCIAFGPGRDMFESTKIIAERLFEKGVEILESDSSREISGPLQFRHQYVNMPEQLVDYTLPNKTVVKVQGCLPAMGYGFAAGTTDGPGAFDFKQGSTTENPLWNVVRNLVAKPSEKDVKCHYPKPIFLLTGKMDIPYRWQPHVVSIQLVRLGDIVIAAVPGEFTTMAGRRLKKTIKNSFSQYNEPQPSEVIIAGLSNTYTSYIVTPEEYELQRYEAASTIYGPHTLPIYQNVYSKLVGSMINNETLLNDTEPMDNLNKVLSFTFSVWYDLPIVGYGFGDCRIQPPLEAKRETIVTAVFVSANPRNNLMHNKTFLIIERLVEQKWVIVATDANWETKFRWRNTFFLAGFSEATIEWYINKDTPIGQYRISHFGHYKPMYGNITPYNGTSRKFDVV